MNLNENDRFTTDVPYKDIRFAEKVKSDYPTHRLDRCGSIMSDLRTIKSSIEIALMQKACDITESAFR